MFRDCLLAATLPTLILVTWFSYALWTGQIQRSTAVPQPVHVSDAEGVFGTRPADLLMQARVEADRGRKWAAGHGG